MIDKNHIISKWKCHLLNLSIVFLKKSLSCCPYLLHNFSTEIKLLFNKLVKMCMTILLISVFIG